MDLDFVLSYGQNIRVHGNGFIQVDLPGKERLHIFGHPAVPRQKSPTPIHDHKFGFVSTVLKGCLVNVVWSAAAPLDVPPSHVVCGYEPGVGEDTKLVPTEQRVLVKPRRTEVLMAGDSYKMRPGDLHETFANEPTATYMRKTDVAVLTPRVLCPIGKEPDNSFDRHAALATPDLWEIVKEVLRG